MATFTEIPISLARETCLFHRHWFDSDLHLAQQIVQSAAENWIPVAIDDYARLDVTDRRHSPTLWPRQGFPYLRSVWLVTQDRDNYRHACRRSLRQPASRHTTDRHDPSIYTAPSTKVRTPAQFAAVAPPKSPFLSRRTRSSRSLTAFSTAAVILLPSRPCQFPHQPMRLLILDI